MAKSHFYVRDAGTVREGENAHFTIQRTGDLSRYEKISYYTTTGSAGSNSDYRYKSGTAYFSPGQSESSVSVQTNSDNYSESTESFDLYAYSPQYRRSNGYYYSSTSNNSIGESTGTAWIQDSPSDVNITINISGKLACELPAGTPSTPYTTVFIPSTFERAGGDAIDVFSGNSNSTKSDIFRGGGGNDKLTGFRGADVLFGNDGNDELRGGNGKDVLSGGNGSDRIYGGFGHQ